MPTFADNLRKLPGISHLQAIHLLDAAGEVAASIENRAGSQGALAVYNHLAQTYGAITPEAAATGLELFAEHVDAARANPGRHPNIDRLLLLVSEQRILRTKHVFAL